MSRPLPIVRQHPLDGSICFHPDAGDALPIVTEDPLLSGGDGSSSGNGPRGGRTFWPWGCALLRHVSRGSDNDENNERSRQHVWPFNHGKRNRVSADETLFVDDDSVGLVHVEKVFRILNGGTHLGGLHTGLQGIHVVEP